MPGRKNTNKSTESGVEESDNNGVVSSVEAGKSQEERSNVEEEEDIDDEQLEAMEKRLEEARSYIGEEIKEGETSSSV